MKPEFGAVEGAQADGLTVCIVGLGLMGGSLALAWRTLPSSGTPAWPSRIVAVNRSRPALEAALAQGAIDYGTTDLAEGVAVADVVVLATPVRTILRQLPEVGQYARRGALVMDLGSSKRAICAALAELDDGLQVIGAHPLCGKETAGFAAADAGLYRGRPFVLCPLSRTNAASLHLAEQLALAAGARPLIADPSEHDRAVAAISHLPYAVAVALTRSVAGDGAAESAGLAWSLAASGFRDTSRLAAQDVDMMLDTLLTNRVAVLDALDTFARELAGLRQALADEDETALRARLSEAQSGRAAIASTARW
jgi:prephenate dehydrogenase